MRSVCVIFYAIISWVAFFEVLFVSLSHSICSIHPSEKKEISPVYRDIRRNEFKEYINAVYVYAFSFTFVSRFYSIFILFPRSK